MVCSMCVSAEDPELVRAWQTFADPVLAHPSGEVVQYLETTRQSRGWVHIFRHRCHPTTHERTYWHVAASPGWTPPH